MNNLSYWDQEVLQVYIELKIDKVNLYLLLKYIIKNHMKDVHIKKNLHRWF